MSTTTTTTTATATHIYTPTMIGASNTPATPMALSPSISSVATSGSMANSMSTTTTKTTATISRVRFDAECIVIPELGSYGSKRPRMVTKSYSLPLWKKGRDEDDEQAHVVLKVALPRSVSFLAFLHWSFRFSSSLYFGHSGHCSLRVPVALILLASWEPESYRPPSLRRYLFLAIVTLARGTALRGSTLLGSTAAGLCLVQGDAPKAFGRDV
ncbi:hypothetical protein B0H12DRAFT_1239649 [Mycena haematopus]|nr:hypothetical protein B0H12DRAFT_1239649 [Mycena haematopus]